MTQRDKWAKRPAVLRYRDYCDRIREAAGTIPDNVYRIEITAQIPMPDSWSNKKKFEMAGKPHRQRPAWDNIGKAVSDALFEEDAVIWDARVLKYWCRAGEECTEIALYFDRE